MNKTVLTSILLSTLLASGCSDTGSNSMNGGRGGAANGMLTLSITDAAVDNATEVWVQFAAIELKPSIGPSFTVTFDAPADINLLSLQGSLSQDLFNSEVVPSGTYEWVRLAVNTDVDILTGVSPSTIVMDDGGVHNLTVPSGNQSGLKINTGFIVGANSETAMTIDFDLRKSIVMSSGDYHLKPVLRLVENDDAGMIAGSVDSSLTLGTDCSDDDPATGNAVYVFSGIDAQLDDIDGQSPDPVTTALLTLNAETGLYDYEVGFIPAGSYTVAFTCMADLDNPEVDDAIVFVQSENVLVDTVPDLGGADINR